MEAEKQIDARLAEHLESFRSFPLDIADSMVVAATKPYIRFYKRNDAGEYTPIVLDVAGV